MRLQSVIDNFAEYTTVRCLGKEVISRNALAHNIYIYIYTYTYKPLSLLKKIIMSLVL